MFRCSIAFCVVAGGCSLVGLGGNDDGYLDARVAPPLEVPTDLDDSTIMDLMVVPPLATMQRRPRDNDVPQPGQLTNRGAIDPVKLQKLGQRRWLVIAEAPSSIWPKVIQFLRDNGVRVVEEVPPDGYLRTEEVSVARGARYRDVVRRIITELDQRARAVELRMQIEQGIRDGFTEVHIRYLHSADAPLVGWPEHSTGIEVEEKLLLELGGYLRADLDRRAHSKLGREISSQPKAWLAKEGGRPSVLRLRLDYGRAWAMVASAFSNAEVDVTDADRDNAIMFVDVERDFLEGHSRGLFRPFGGGSEELEIRLEPWPGGFDVAVYQGEAPAPEELGELVLVLIRDFAT